MTRDVDTGYVCWGWEICTFHSILLRTKNCSGKNKALRETLAGPVSSQLKKSWGSTVTGREGQRAVPGWVEPWGRGGRGVLVEVGGSSGRRHPSSWDRWLLIGGWAARTVRAKERDGCRGAFYMALHFEPYGGLCIKIRESLKPRNFKGWNMSSGVVT